MRNPLERQTEANVLSPQERTIALAGWAIAAGLACVTGIIFWRNNLGLTALFASWLPLTAILLGASWGLWAAWGRQHRDHRYLATLARATRILCQEDLEQVLHTTSEQMLHTTGADSCILFLADDDGELLVPRVVKLDPNAYGPEEEAAWWDLRVLKGKGMVGWVLANRTAILCGDSERDPRSQYLPGSLPESASCLVVPFLLGERVLGVIRVSRKGLNQFSQEDLHLATVLAGQAAVAVEQARLKRELEELLVTDPLTGVYNRHYLQRVLQPQLKAMATPEMAALMIDLYDFKSFNDTYGHLAGDQRLQVTGRLLRDNVRHSDIVVRYGGDEFVVVMPGATEDDARVAASRITAAVEQFNQESPHKTPLGLNIGIRSAAVDNLEQLLNQADAAMYVDKRRADRRRINHLLTLLEQQARREPVERIPTLAEAKGRLVGSNGRFDPEVVAALLDVLALEEERAEHESQ